MEEVAFEQVFEKRVGFGNGEDSGKTLEASGVPSTKVGAGGHERGWTGGWEAGWDGPRISGKHLGLFWEDQGSY